MKWGKVIQKWGGGGKKKKERGKIIKKLCKIIGTMVGVFQNIILVLKRDVI